MLHSGPALAGDRAVSLSPEDATAPAADVSATLPQGPILETVVVGFQLSGKGLLDRFRIADLDIVMEGKGARFLPLLRILRAVQVEWKATNQGIEIQGPSGTSPVLDWKAGLYRSGSGESIVDLRAGVSDMTREPELFVSEDFLAQALSMTLRWKEDLYEYEATTERDLSVFHRRERVRQTPSAARPPEPEIYIPEMFGTAQPSRVRGVTLDFLQSKVNASLMMLPDAEETIVAPTGQATVSLWGRAFGGSFDLALSETGQSGPARLVFEEGSWVYSTPRSEFAAGDRVFGLSQLSFPSVSMTGVGLNGLVGGSGPDWSATEPSQLGRRTSFASPQRFSGTAPLRSTIELWINNSLVDSRGVEELPGMPPGEGYYQFEGVNLLTGQLNDVRIVITRPDSTQSEMSRQVMGTNQLLEPGQFAYVAGVGTKREPYAISGPMTYGFFSGARLLFGLNKRVTMGATLALQDRFASPAFRLDSDDVTYGYMFEVPPEKTLHPGCQIVARLLDPVVISTEVAASRAEVDTSRECSGVAWRTDVTASARSLRIGSHLFRYSPGFFNGQNARLSDREGYALTAQWQRASDLNLRLATGRVHNNVDEVDGFTAKDHFYDVSLRTRRVIPKTGTEVRFGRINRNHGETGKLLGLVFNSAVLPGWDFEGRINSGGHLNSMQDDDLLSDLAIPGVGYFGGTGSVVRLARRIGEGSRIEFSHWSSQDRARSVASLGLQGKVPTQWNWRGDAGWDWESRTTYLQTRVDLALGGTGRRLSFDSRLDRGQWTGRLYFQYEGVLGFIDNRPVRLDEKRVTPDQGGIKGKVFEDSNGNGTMDPGEVGLEGIQVTLDGRQNVITREGGGFLFSSGGKKGEVRVSLTPDAIPVIYAPTHGVQTALLVPGRFTEVNLGLAPLGSVSGRVIYLDEQGEEKPLGGVRVLVLRPDGTMVQKSVTAADGSYYLGELRPGEYRVNIDTETLPTGWKAESLSRSFHLGSKTEGLDIQAVNFVISFESAPEPEKIEEPAEGQPQKKVKYKKFD